MRTIIFLSIVAIIGCEGPYQQAPTILRHTSDEELKRYGEFEQGYIIRIRNCEYAGIKSSTGSSVVHAGDCSNPAHQYPCDTPKP